ncbi:peptidyl-tRNA hydrolase [Candidatus Woesearchaeota archaeon]|nr:peptidyl-tRNA hydrolase [Candidatus Woesearchaeota archaeon]
MELKQVILVREDLKLPKGKLAAQVAHAAVDAALKLQKKDESLLKRWYNSGMKKIVLKVTDEKELYKYIQIAKDQGIITSIITDAGHTVVKPGTVTCGAIGPAEEEQIDAITSKLKMM